MAAVMAGWLLGYAMAIASTIALTMIAVRQGPDSYVQRTLGDGKPGLTAAIIVFTGSVIAWTMAGLLLGSTYEVLELADQPSFLGSPSAPFLIGMFGLAILPLGPLVLLFPRRWPMWCALSALFVVLFGWLMPILAAR
jgi:hypothetical protein